MLQDKIKSAITTGGAWTLVGGALLLLLILCPFLFIWTVNSLAESGGVDFRLEHSLWNYFLAILFVAIVRGGSTGGKS